MNRDFFVNQIERLCNTYGRSSFGDERIALLWQKLRDYSDNALEQAVTSLIENERYAPMPNTIYEYISKFSHFQKEKTEEQNFQQWLQRNKCSFVFQSGEQCQRVATMSSSTTGSGVWYCPFHFQYKNDPEVANNKEEELKFWEERRRNG